MTTNAAVTGPGAGTEAPFVRIANASLHYGEEDEGSLALQGFDLDIAGRVAIPPVVTPENLRYLRTKRDRMGHDISLAGS